MAAEGDGDTQTTENRGSSNYNTGSTLRDVYGFVIQPSYVSLYHAYAPVWRSEEHSRNEAWTEWIDELTSRALVEPSNDAQNRCCIALDTALGHSRGENMYHLKHLQLLVEHGVPRRLRKICWKKFLMEDDLWIPGEYQRLVDKIHTLEMNANDEDILGEDPFYKEYVEECLPQIDKDLHRTFPDHFLMDHDAGKQKLRRILGAYALRNPLVGYCQGLNFLAGLFLLMFIEEEDEEDAFWCFVALVENILTGYFDPMMINQQVDGLVFEQLLIQLMPPLASHLDDIGVHIPTVVSAWFLIAFVNAFPTETLLRVWDVLLFEKSPVVLVRVSLALIEIYAKALMETHESGECYMIFQGLAPITFDSTTLIETACRSFAHVKDSALSVLRDKYAPGVTTIMNQMYKIESNLPPITISSGVPKTSLSRSGCMAKVDKKYNDTALSTGLEKRLGILKLRHHNSASVEDSSAPNSDDLVVLENALRRTQSESFAINDEGVVQPRNERLQQELRINLLAMRTFIPDMKLMQTAFEIAATRSSQPLDHDGDEKQQSSPILCEGHEEDRTSNQTMDVADLTRRMKNQMKSPQPVMRRFTDGGALLVTPHNKHKTSAIWTKNANIQQKMVSVTCALPEQQEKIAMVCTQLGGEVASASSRLHHVEKTNEDLETTVHEIQEQLRKIQDEIAHRATICNVLYERAHQLRSDATQLELDYRSQLTKNETHAQTWKTIQREIKLNNNKLKKLMNLAGKDKDASHHPSSPTKKIRAKLEKVLINRKFTR